MSPSYEVLRRALRLQWYPCQQLMAWVQSWEYVTWTPLKTLLQESKAPTLSKPSSRWKADEEEKLFQIESVLTGKTAKYNMFSGIGSRIKEERERGRDLAKVGCGLWIRQLYCTGVDSLFGDLWVAFRCVVVFMKTIKVIYYLSLWITKNVFTLQYHNNPAWCTRDVCHNMSCENYLLLLHVCFLCNSQSKKPVISSFATSLCLCVCVCIFFLAVPFLSSKLKKIIINSPT